MNYALITSVNMQLTLAMFSINHKTFRIDRSPYNWFLFLAIFKVKLIKMIINNYNTV